jgi:hypothetical protein
MMLTNLSILVVSYSDDTRVALLETLGDYGVAVVACTTFREAEDQALHGFYNGLLIDLPSIVKAKGEEKLIAYTLTNFFPTLRVRAIGSALVPMAMPGGAKQDKSLSDFLTKTCSAFPPRKPRAHKRHPVCLPVLLRYRGEESRGFTLNVSWGGAFIVDVQAERFIVGENVEISLPRFNSSIRAIICWIMPWGMNSAPGVGASFTEMDESLEAVLADLLKSRREFDRDRLIA